MYGPAMRSKEIRRVGACDDRLMITPHASRLAGYSNQGKSKSCASYPRRMTGYLRFQWLESANHAADREFDLGTNFASSMFAELK
jgi:hypothetical protein